MADHHKAKMFSKLRFLLFIIPLLCTSLMAQTSMTQMPEGQNSGIPISVSVTGKVKNPGSFYLTNMNRVTDAIYHASLIKMTQSEPIQNKLQSADNKKSDQEGQYVQTEESIFAFDNDSSFRNVILHRNGKDIKLDVLRFIRIGDTTQNPFLQDGDVIILQPVKMKVTFDGTVFQPGQYEINDHETLGDMMIYTQGMKPETDLDRVFVYRYMEDGKSLITYNIPRQVMENLKPGSGMELKDGDRIEFGSRSDYHPDRSVTIKGEVKFPGTYAIQDSISLLDLLHRAGGPTDKADLRNAQAFNNIRVEAYDPAYSFLKLQNYVVTNKSDEDYLRMKIRQPVGLIATNVEKLWITQDKSLDIYLHNEDNVNVPEVNRTITLLGQVETPGVYDWHPEMTWSEYIDHAGGYNWHADIGKIRIIRAFSGNWIKPTKDMKLNTGDMIFIPSKPDRTNWDVFKETLLITSQIVTILFAVKSLTQ